MTQLHMVNWYKFKQNKNLLKISTVSPNSWLIINSLIKLVRPVSFGEFINLSTFWITFIVSYCSLFYYCCTFP